jgi:hypothetical protein
MSRNDGSCWRAAQFLFRTSVGGHDALANPCPSMETAFELGRGNS